MGLYEITSRLHGVGYQINYLQGPGSPKIRGLTISRTKGNEETRYVINESCYSSYDAKTVFINGVEGNTIKSSDRPQQINDIEKEAYQMLWELFDMLMRSEAFKSELGPDQAMIWLQRIADIILLCSSINEA